MRLDPSDKQEVRDFTVFCLSDEILSITALSSSHFIRFYALNFMKGFV